MKDKCLFFILLFFLIFPTNFLFSSGNKDEEFLDIDEKLQRERILKRNTPVLAQRFFDEWIPLEKRYFNEMRIKEKCDLIIKIN